MMIFAGMYGYLDSIAIEDINEFKKNVWSQYNASNIEFDLSKKLNIDVLNQFFKNI
jgi:hypothetical protein